MDAGKLNLLLLAGFAVAVSSGCLLLLSGPGYRFEWWGLRFAIRAFKLAAYGGLIGALICALYLALGLTVARLQSAWLVLCLLGMGAGIASAWLPWQQLQLVKRLPMIHDITTDTENPPAFHAVQALRKSSANTTEYAGAALAAQQQQAYPDIQPLQLTLPTDESFESALAAAAELNWEIVASSPEAGRIEATDTTFWFGYKDDIVIRITALESGGTRIDVRSVSRVGQSDLGANAQRIRRFLAALDPARRKR